MNVNFLIGLLIVVILALLYLLPAFISVVRSHHNYKSIICLNVLLGWSFIGWIISLIWSLSHIPTPTYEYPRTCIRDIEHHIHAGTYAGSTTGTNT